MPDNSDQKRLTELLTQQLELFEQVYKLCEEQTRLLDADKFTELDESLGRTQKLREQINGLHQEAEPLMQSCVSATQNQDDGITGLAGKVREKLEMCSKINDQNMSMLKKKSKEQSKKIDEQRAKREGIGGYAQVLQNSPELFDKKT